MSMSRRFGHHDMSRLLQSATQRRMQIAYVGLLQLEGLNLGLGLGVFGFGVLGFRVLGFSGLGFRV